jgi:signal transduction histidine kinase
LLASQSSLAVPLLNKHRLVAFALLGSSSDRPLDHPDRRDLLTALAQNAANALDSILVHDDLHQSQTLMRRTDRLRSLEIIAGGFAHEIRNPLTSIKTFIQLAPERKDDTEFIHDFSRIVLDDVHRIERLIQEILDYARYMEPKLTEEDLNELVTSCLYFIEVKADSKRIKIEKQLASGLPRVMLDRQQIKQVLLNLLLNAIDAMGDGGGELKVRTHRLMKPGAKAWTQIEIEDSGPGISKANLEHIFDPFFTTKHTSGEHAGTGLGLTIVHQIIQEHTGEIQVESTEGVGTTFSVNLPALPID